MKNPYDYAELCNVVALCWQVAGKAPMEGVPVDVIAPDGSMRIARVETYRVLLQSLIPTVAVTRGEMSSTVAMQREKESWEE